MLFLEQFSHNRVRLAPDESVIQGVDQAPDLQHFQLLATVVEHGFRDVCPLVGLDEEGFQDPVPMIGLEREQQIVELVVSHRQENVL